MVVILLDLENNFDSTKITHQILTFLCFQVEMTSLTVHECIGVPMQQRINSMRMLYQYHEEWMTVRDIEAAVNSFSKSKVIYMDKMQQLIFNLKVNPSLIRKGVDVVLLTDAQMAQGTIVEDIERESEAQSRYFDNIIAEKFEMVNRSSSKTLLRCRRCGSDDVACEQKQTRGADEAMTLFCTCSKCQMRWTMR
jgi:DNA-directed RNA polymerase subunit M/transcription elongation factor TFIIS